MNPDDQDVAPGFEQQDLRGRRFEVEDAAGLREAVDKALDYRGDVTLTLDDGSAREGYLFDRRESGPIEDSVARLLLKDGSGKVSIPYARIRVIEFTGRDTAAGKSWEAWVRKYRERKAAGEASVELTPDERD